jgi:hypothetical protein
MLSDPRRYAETSAGWRPGCPTSPTTASSWWPPAPAGALAYTLGYERFSLSLDGGPVQPHTLRVTHVYRREDGEWKVVHRHADAPRPVSSSRRGVAGVGVPAQRPSSVNNAGPGTTPGLSHGGSQFKTSPMRGRLQRPSSAGSING